MNNTLPEDALKASIDKRILNEFAVKILNEEKLTKIIDERGKNTRFSKHADTLFSCECDDDECVEFISISTEEYTSVHHKTKQFIIINKHVRLDIEEVIEKFSNYTLVEKYFPHQKGKIS